MTRRNISFAQAIPIGAYIFIICCRMAAAQGAPPPAVTVAPVVSRQVTETGDFIGRVVAIDKVDIVARVSGFIKERNFTEGQQVKTGDLLFRIEPDIYKATVDQQSANVAKAKATEVNANLQLQRGQELLHNQNIPQSTDVLQAQALLEQAKINLGTRKSARRSSVVRSHQMLLRKMSLNSRRRCAALGLRLRHFRLSP